MSILQTIKTKLNKALHSRENPDKSTNDNDEDLLRISLAHDFSPFPGGRYPNDGEFNATRFRDKILVPALKTGKVVEVSLDGVGAVAASFLEEAFGCWSKVEELELSYVQSHLRIVTTEEVLDVHASLSHRYLAGEVKKFGAARSH